MFDFDCVILPTPMNSRASVRLGGGEGWGAVRDPKQLRLLSLCLGRGVGGCEGFKATEAFGLCLRRGVTFKCN